MIYDVHLSDKFEPFAVVAAIHRERGKLMRLNPDQLADLELVLAEFRQKFGLRGETYHYTSYEERMATDAFVAGGGASTASKAHSSDFHLKIRVSSAMYHHAPDLALLLACCPESPCCFCFVLFWGTTRTRLI